MRLKAAIEARAADTTALVIECYPEVSYEELKDESFSLPPPGKIVCTDDCAVGIERVQKRIADCITDDRVLGILSHHRIE